MLDTYDPLKTLDINLNDMVLEDDNLMPSGLMGPTCLNFNKTVIAAIAGLL